VFAGDGPIDSPSEPPRAAVAPYGPAMLYYADGPMGTISVLDAPAKKRTIYVDNVGVAGTAPAMLTDQKSLAHVPMLFIPDPKKVLTVGFGSGGASYSFSTYPQLEEIHCVEIDPTVPRAAITLTRSNWGFLAPKYRLNGEEKVFLPEHAARRLALDGKTHSNPVPQIWDWLPSERDHRPTTAQAAKMASAGEENVYEDFRAPDGAELAGYYAADPRYRLILDDAREWLQSTDTVYDVIATDCTDLRYKTNANLYDLQYFKACRERLSDQGLVVVWMPMGGLTERMYKVALKTFATAFPKWGVWFMSNEPTHYCLLLGWKGDFKIDLPALEERLLIPAVKRDLSELFLDSPEKILSCYVADHRTLDAWLGDVPLNTEDRPVLEFEAPKALRNDLEGQLAANLQGMVDRRNDVMDYAAGPPEAVAAMRERLKPWEQAEPIIIEGHRHYRDGETFETLLPAQEAYMEALAICPQDASLRNQLDFHELRKSAEKGQQGHDQLMLGRLYKAQGRPGDALTYLKMLADRQPPPREDNPETFALFAGWQRIALEEMAGIYEAEGQPERAAKALARAEALKPLEAGGASEAAKGGS
jgi:spermidine synthase